VRLAGMPAKPARRSRPLRCEDPEQLFFVTTRTLEEVFWLHPLPVRRLVPVNRSAEVWTRSGRGSERNVGGTCHRFCPDLLFAQGNVPPFLPRLRNQRGIRATGGNVPPFCPD
jgi:hypothetical protein